MQQSMHIHRVEFLSLEISQMTRNIMERFDDRHEITTKKALQVLGQHTIPAELKAETRIDISICPLSIVKDGLGTFSKRMGTDAPERQGWTRAATAEDRERFLQ